jgi:hypothetical protein
VDTAEVWVAALDEPGVYPSGRKGVRLEMLSLFEGNEPVDIESGFPHKGLQAPKNNNKKTVTNGDRYNPLPNRKPPP